MIMTIWCPSSQKQRRYDHPHFMALTLNVDGSLVGNTAVDFTRVLVANLLPTPKGIAAYIERGGYTMKTTAVAGWAVFARVPCRVR